MSTQNERTVKMSVSTSDWNGGWRYGLVAEGDLIPFEWSRPFDSKEEAENAGKIEVDRLERTL